MVGVFKKREKKKSYLDWIKEKNKIMLIRIVENLFNELWIN